MSYTQVYPLQISQSMSMSGAYVLVLDAPENGKQVPIIIGEAEAQAIVMAIEQKQARRPLTHNLLNNILEEYLLVLKQVTIDRFEEGIFYQGNNSCGNGIGDGIPSNVVALVDEENPNNINVSWDGISGVEGYGYTVYRDGLFHRLIPEGTSFVDENAPVGGHCYVVGYLYDGGENGFYSNESCATAGACYAPTDIDFEYTGNAYKIKLKWEKPEPADGLSGYYLFRKFGENDTYQRIKLLSASATSYTDNSANQEGDYYYKLYAYYADLDCTSAPAYWKYDNNQFFIKVYYSADAVNELEANSVSVFPNPTTSQFTIEGEGLNHVTVFNTMGQKVYEMNCQGESVDVNLSHVETGVYMVRISTVNGETTKRITIIR